MKLRFFIAIFIASFIGVSSLYSWEILDVDSGKNGYHKPVVKFGPSGVLYMVYKGGKSVWLSSYDGKELQLMKEVSSNPDNTAYEPFLIVDANEDIHVTWCEYSSSDSKNHQLKYRKYSGQTWGNEVTLTTLHAEAIEDIRMAVDSKGNVFVVGSEEEGGNLVNAFMVSKYGDHINHDSFSNKHAWVDVDNDFVHVVWQGKRGGEYSIWYGKKENKPDGSWLKREAKTSHDSARPSICRDLSGNLHITYNHEALVGANQDVQREIWYFSSSDNGDSFNSGEKLKGFGITHFLDISSTNGTTYIAAQAGPHLKGSGVLYNINRGEGWSGFSRIPGTDRCRCQGSTVSADGATIVTAFTREESSVHLAIEGSINANSMVDIGIAFNKIEKKIVRSLLFKRACYDLSWNLHNQNGEIIDKIQIERRDKSLDGSQFLLVDTVSGDTEGYIDRKGVGIDKEFDYKLIVYWTDSEGNKGWTDSNGNTERL